MKFSLALAAMLPAVMAARVPYAVPKELDQNNGTFCELPVNFQVKNFVGKQTNGSDSMTYHFQYVNIATNTRTVCKAKSNSRGVSRSSCKDKKVSFKFATEEQSLSVFERTCSDSTSPSNWEAVGKAPVFLACTDNACATNSTITGTFSGLQPVKHARQIRKRGVAWSYDIYN